MKSLVGWHLCMPPCFDMMFVLTCCVILYFQSNFCIGTSVDVPRFSLGILSNF